MTPDVAPVRAGQWGGMSRFLRVLLRHPGVDNRLAALGRFVVRQTHKRIVGGPMIVRWEGMQLAVTPESTAAAAAYYLRRPDWWEFAFIERFQPGGLVDFLTNDVRADDQRAPAIGEASHHRIGALHLAFDRADGIAVLHFPHPAFGDPFCDGFSVEIGDGQAGVLRLAPRKENGEQEQREKFHECGSCQPASGAARRWIVASNDRGRRRYLEIVPDTVSADTVSGSLT